MRKFLLILIITMMLIPTKIKAANNSATISFTGTTSTYNNELAIIEVHSITQSAVNNISGTINYDKTVLAIFKIEVSDDLGDWNFKVDSSKAGTITFTGTSSSDTLLQDRMLFKITFIVHGSLATSTTLTTGSITSSVKTQDEITEQVVTNQDEIDKAKADGLPEEEWPEPIIEEVKKTVDKEETIEYASSSHTISISKRISSDCYLKELSVDDANISPVFNKLTNAYKVTIDKEAEVKINYTTEDPSATVVIQDEVNNQIVITVTAENGTNNTYVLTIIRQANYDSTDPKNNTQEDVDPTTNTDVEPTEKVTTNIDTSTLIVLIGLSIVSVIGISIGSILIYKGSRQ